MKKVGTNTRKGSDGRHISYPAHFPHASPLYERPIGAANAALDAESAEVLETIEGLLA